MARSRYRSVTYHLEASVDLARMVEQAGGHTDMEALASLLSYSGVRNGAFLTRLANARLFGLVAGRSGQVTLLDRGRRCLSSDPVAARAARIEACLAIPLFRHVLERLSAAGRSSAGGAGRPPGTSVRRGTRTGTGDGQGAHRVCPTGGPRHRRTCRNTCVELG